MNDVPERIGVYTVLRELGRGGMGIVYLGLTPTGRSVAIKVIRADLIISPVVRARFEREILAARRVPTWCTAEVLHSDVGADPPYFVSEYIEGPSLHQSLVETGKLSRPDLNRLAVGVSGALSVIHKEIEAHRDLTPSNIILGRFGPRVIDFGLASLADVLTHTLTDHGAVLGTSSFMSPEQAAGEKSGPASDIYAWALIIICAASGRVRMTEDEVVSFLQDEYCMSRLGVLASHVTLALSSDPVDRPTSGELFKELAGNHIEVVMEVSQHSIEEPVRSIRTRAQILAEARSALQAARPLLALELAETGLKLNNIDAKMQFLKSESLGALNREQESVTALRLAYEIDSNDEEIRRAQALRWATSALSVEAAYRIAPESSEVRQMYADHLIKKQRFEEAYAIDPAYSRDSWVRHLLKYSQYSAAYAIDPQAAPNTFARMLISQGDLLEAFMMYPDFTANYYSKGIAGETLRVDQRMATLAHQTRPRDPHISEVMRAGIAGGWNVAEDDIYSSVVLCELYVFLLSGKASSSEIVRSALSDFPESTDMKKDAKVCALERLLRSRLTAKPFQPHRVEDFDEALIEVVKSSLRTREKARLRSIADRRFTTAADSGYDAVLSLAAIVLLCGCFLALVGFTDMAFGEALLFGTLAGASLLIYVHVLAVPIKKFRRRRVFAAYKSSRPDH